nr:hypothetical protein B0A51_08284 [Rachicladosporium sp. CCFEE 5018]
MERRTNRWLLLALALLLRITIVRHADIGRIRHVAHNITNRLRPLYTGAHANTTLGFGAIIAVSRPGSSRREGLIRAANITEIDITIPDQPQWTAEDIANLRAAENSTITRGSALAWLGHLTAIRYFLHNTTLSTVLILEDDVDFSLHLRTHHIPLAATAMRMIASNLTIPPSPRNHKSRLQNYWGIPNTWDLLYLGHCGDFYAPESLASLPQSQVIIYPDATLPPHSALHGKTSSQLSDLHVPEGHRLLHPSISPLCTFAFALTRHSAHRILTQYAAREADGGTEAYDVRILEACRDPTFRCWTVNPELFHHVEAESEIAAVNGGEQWSVTEAEGDAREEAFNIGCGVRGLAVREGESVAEARERLRGEERCRIGGVERDEGQQGAQRG